MEGDSVVETIPGALREAAKRFTSDEAVVDGARRLTFSELEDHAEQVARALIASGIDYPTSAVITTFAWASFMRSRSDSGEKPPKTTE